VTDPDFDVAIVGAGAAGLMAAIFAGRTARRRGAGSRIVALDGAARVGAKILIAGGGRCNVTHHAVTANDFHGNQNTIAKVLRSFGVPETVRFFDEIGVRLKREETGKLFPVTDRAQTVLDALLGATASAGAEIRTGWRVESIERTGEGFQVVGRDRRLRARRVILATGGRSVPRTGSDGAGYGIAKALGHSLTPVFPALVPLLLPKGHWMTELKGIAVDVELRLRSDRGKILHRRAGSMLFAHFGLTGPVVLDTSRSWISARRAGDAVVLDAAFLPGRSFEDVEREWIRIATDRPDATVGSTLRRDLPERVADALSRHGAEVDPSARLAKLSRNERRRLVRALVEIPVDVVGDRGFDVAEVTAGGVPLEEIDSRTMASRRCDGLYLCGEILDVDGRIGGFNFQWAWATGRLAGIEAAG